MIIDNDAIITDAEYDDSDAGSTESAANAFLKKWDAEKPSDTSEEDETDEDEDEAEADDSDADGNDHDETDDDAHADDDDSDDDERMVKVKVKGELKSVSVKDLKRLYGREQALTGKETELAERRKSVETDRERYALATKNLLEKAVERFKPYQDIDWLVAAHSMDTETLKAVRAEAQRAYNDVEFHKTEIQSLYDASLKQQRSDAEATAKVTLDVLTKEIPNFPKAYPKMMAYALEKGMSQAYFDTILDPVPLRILYKAMTAERGKNVVTKTVAKSPTKVIKASRNVESTRSANARGPKADALSKLRISGSTDDAADAFLARFNRKD